MRTKSRDYTDFAFTERNECCIDLQPKVVLKRLSTEEIEKYDKRFYDKYCHKPVVVVEEAIERDIHCIESQEFMRYLNVIQTTELVAKPINSLKKSFPLRGISRISAQVVDREVIERQNCLSIKTSGKTQPKKSKNRQRLGLRLTPKISPRNEQILRERNRKNRIFRFISRLEMTSKLSQSLSTTLGFRPLSQRMVHELSTQSVPEISYPKNKKLLNPLQRHVNGFNRWLPRNIEMKAKVWELSEKLSEDHFDYGFTRRQSLEKRLRRKTGLNWRSRLLSLHCKPFTVAITRLEEPSEVSKPVNHRLDPMVRQSDSQICNKTSTGDWDLEFELTKFVNKSMQTNFGAVVEDNDHKKWRNGLHLKSLSIVLEKDERIDSMAKQMAIDIKSRELKTKFC